MTISIAIPTYERGAILADTIARLLELETHADEILIVDQTKQHPTEVDAKMQQWSKEGAIRWIRLPQPSIPHAMNEALLRAANPIVLFLDDDIEPSPNLVAEHLAAHRDEAIWAVVGQILQPGEKPERVVQPADDLEFRFNADEPAMIANVMAGNLSVKRGHAIAAGGFDENYIGAAYRFETDFARRLANAGGTIRFEPRASLRHLKLSTGGLRQFGDHRTTASPAHTVGDYYFALQHVPHFWPYALRRLRKNVLTRFLLAHPWHIPAKLAGELRGLFLARKLSRKGARLLGIQPDGERLRRTTP